MKGRVDLYQLVVARHGAENIRPLLVAVEEAERWDIVRRLVSTVLVVLGGVCWVLAAFPSAFGFRVRMFSLGLWAVFLVMLLTAIAAGRVWRRRCAQFRVATMVDDDEGP